MSYYIKTKIGALLPCNVTVRETENRRVDG